MDLRIEYERVNRKYETFFMPKVQRAIHTKVLATIHVLRERGTNAAHAYLTGHVGNPNMQDVIRDLYITVGKRHAQMTYSRLLPEVRGRKAVSVEMEMKGFGFNQRWVDFILSYLNRFLIEKISFEVDNTTRKALLAALAIYMNEGLSVDQTIQQLKEWPFERYQAARIVRTEVNRAANVGAKAQAETSDYLQVKEWLSADDFRVRGRNPKDHADHWGLNGTKIDAEDLFHDRVSGDYLEFPGDPKASAATTINCRCQAAHTFKRDANGNLIPKRRSTTVLYPGQIRRPQTIAI